MKTPMLATLILATLSVGAFADPVAMADSRGAYEIVRLSTTFEGRAGVPTVIQTADRVTTSDTPVQVQLINGESILLGENSAVNFPDASTVALDSGDMALALAPASVTAVAVDTLRIVPFNEPVQKIATSTGGLVVKLVKEGEMTVQALNQTLTVMNNAIGKQIAVIGKNDTVRFLRDGLGNWLPAGSEIVKSHAGTGGTTGTSTGGGTAGNRERRKTKAAWWTTPAGIGGIAVGTVAVVGGTAYAVDKNNDDDKNDDEEDDNNGGGFPPPSSPIN